MKGGGYNEYELGEITWWCNIFIYIYLQRWPSSYNAVKEQKNQAKTFT